LPVVTSHSLKVSSPLPEAMVLPSVDVHALTGHWFARLPQPCYNRVPRRTTMATEK
jgi:hypothetical protein